MVLNHPGIFSGINFRQNQSAAPCLATTKQQNECEQYCREEQADRSGHQRRPPCPGWSALVDSTFLNFRFSANRQAFRFVFRIDLLVSLPRIYFG